MGIEANERLAQFCIPSLNKVQKVQNADFHDLIESKLSSIQSLLDGLPREHKENEDLTLENEIIEDALHPNLTLLQISEAFLELHSFNNSNS